MKATTKKFGERLKALRRARGITQRELAEKIGISRRMLVYYESQSDRPPATKLPTIAKVLGASVDELLGVKPLKDLSPKNVRLWKKLRMIDKLPPKDQKALIQIIDGLLAKQKLNDA